MRLTNRHQRWHVQLPVAFKHISPSHPFETRWPPATGKAPHVAAMPLSLTHRLICRVSCAPLDISPCLCLHTRAKMDESARGRLRYLVVTISRGIIITLVLHPDAAKLML